MLDLFIISGSIFGVLFSFYGLSKFTPWAIFLGAFLFLIISMGIFVGGYETYDNAPITITSTSSTVEEITFSKIVYNPDISGDFNQIILYVYSLFMLILGILLFLKSTQEAYYNRVAKKVAG